MLQKYYLYACEKNFNFWTKSSITDDRHLTRPFKIFLTTIDLDLNWVSYKIGKISPVKSTELNGISKQLEWEIQSSTELVPRD